MTSHLDIGLVDIITRLVSLSGYQVTIFTFLVTDNALWLVFDEL